jgi:hypothetical protein
LKKRVLKKKNLVSSPIIVRRKLEKLKAIFKLSKEERIQRARANLIAKINTNRLDTFIARVAYILNHYEETRNSDKKLALLYWETFQNDIYKGVNITPEQYYDLEPQTSITRARAKIQNEFKLFLADEKIERYRRKKEEHFREEQVTITPPKPIITVNCDEAKEKNAMVGSVWSVNPSRYHQLWNTIREWKAEKQLKPTYEFHFSHSKKHEVGLYKEFIDLIAIQSDTLSFKAVVTNTENSKRKIDEIITDLYTVLIVNGLKHEIESGRVLLPRIINVFKDLEDAKDKLYLEIQKQQLQQTLKVEYEGDANLEIMEGIISYTSPFIQIADLFTGCVGRKLNVTGTSNHKDEISDYFFEKFEIDTESYSTKNSDFINIIFL